ncbi:protoglobin domain-containing protein [Terasakiella pusilla]|uniref:protoglobin domain-containing protein n=1 Tax=Terasakiella pusilla TaxID=64973 RepID=UPI003AA95E10
MDIQTKLSYFQIDESVKTTLRDARPFLLEVLPDVLKSFYDFVTTHPESREKFQGKKIDRLIAVQSSHWGKLFSGDFDEEYLQTSLAIGRVHEKIGITPYLYIGGYNFVQKRLTSLVIQRFGKKGEQCAQILNAINASILLDMELALTSYADASNNQSANDFANDLLDDNISLSIAVNEVSVGNASMMKSLDDISLQIQSVAGAVQQLTAGVSSIRP